MTAVFQPRFKQDGDPLNGQIASLMRRRMEAGEWKAGSRRPSLEELVQAFNVARVTIRQAVEVLETEGLLVPQQGRGTFVSQVLPERRWLRLGAEWTDLLVT